MTLDRFRSVADRMLEPFVRGALWLGVTPNVVSVVALLMALGAGLAYAFASEMRLLYLVGAILVFLNGWLDLLDGALARELSTASAGGDLLDHVIDRYADVLVVAGLAAGIERWALGFAAITGVLLTSYLGTQAQAVGIDRLYAGLVGRADRLAIVGVVTGIAAFVEFSYADFGLVVWLLVFLAIVGHLTTLQRFFSALRSVE